MRSPFATALITLAGLAVVAAFALAFLPAAQSLRVSLGITDGCLACHGEVKGLSGAHAPQRIGCASCHGGDRFAPGKDSAHAGLVLMPGHLADAKKTCAQSGCHESILPRVENSIMTTMAGVIAVDREVLGDPPGEGLPHAARLGHGVADSHLRELCVGCHLGQSKEVLGPIGQKTQGGGCLACHLEYGEAAAKEVAAYAAAKPGEPRTMPTTHPGLALNPPNGHCFGCHSRSGRIATSYEGWHEVHGTPEAAKSGAAMGGKRLKKIDDGRWFERQAADAHHEKGLACIDCHNANELMGAGAPVARKRQQQKVGCEDCHAAKLVAVGRDSIDAESRTLMALRGWKLAKGERMGTTRDGDPLVNVVVREDGSAILKRKRDGAPHPLRPPAAACTEGKAHDRLSCSACHTAWAPRCVSCHTQYDPADEGFDHAAQKWGPGTWNETGGRFEALPPALGVLAEGKGRGAIDTFVPGMVMTFDRNREAGKPPETIFRRLYAKLNAHTIRKEVRDCAACHRDPATLGLGKGELRFAAKGGTGTWSFRPAMERLKQDGLPADAWTGFLEARTGMVSTREGARPFSPDEQKRILAVGACLGCHRGDSPAMKKALADFDAAFAARGPQCVVAAWPAVKAAAR